MDATRAKRLSHQDITLNQELTQVIPICRQEQKLSGNFESRPGQSMRRDSSFKHVFAKLTC
jgi:hypothetical protein